MSIFAVGRTRQEIDTHFFYHTNYIFFECYVKRCFTSLQGLCGFSSSFGWMGDSSMACRCELLSEMCVINWRRKEGISPLPAATAVKETEVEYGGCLLNPKGPFRHSGVEYESANGLLELFSPTKRKGETLEIARSFAQKLHFFGTSIDFSFSFGESLVTRRPSPPKVTSLSGCFRRWEEEEEEERPQ